jgi:hypothetical protein
MDWSLMTTVMHVTEQTMDSTDKGGRYANVRFVEHLDS